MSQTPSVDLQKPEGGLTTKSSSFSKFKKHMHNIKKEWGPLLAAKEHWDDEYNFPPGRFAGQRIHGVDPKMIS